MKRFIHLVIIHIRLNSTTDKSICGKHALLRDENGVERLVHLVFTLSHLKRLPIDKGYEEICKECAKHPEVLMYILSNTGKEQ